MNALLPSVITMYDPLPPPLSACTHRIAQVDNFSPTSPTIPVIANHVANFLNSPDIMFFQEIQDNSGPTDDGTVIANVTLTNLALAVQKAGNSSAVYNFTEIPPINDESGGEHGGNIRNAYLYALTISQTIASPVRS